MPEQSVPKAKNSDINSFLVTVVQPAREHPFNSHHLWRSKTVLRNYSTSLRQSWVSSTDVFLFVGCPCMITHSYNPHLGQQVQREYPSLVFTPDVCFQQLHYIVAFDNVFFTQWFAVLHLLVMLRFILKYLSRDLVCFTFIYTHVFSLHLLLLSSF